MTVLMIQTDKPARGVRFVSPRMGRGRNVQDDASNDDACHLLKGMKHVYCCKAGLLFVRFDRSSMGAQEGDDARSTQPRRLGEGYGDGHESAFR